MSIRPYKKIMPTLGEDVYVDEQACVIGDVTLGDDSSVWPCAVVRGDVNTIRIGSRTNIQDNSMLHVTHKNEEFPDGFALTIGDDVTVGHNVVLHACTINNRCLIGMGAVVLDGAVLEEHVMIGANSLVPPGKVLESGYLYLGSPVKQIRPLTEKEIAHFEYSAKHYAKLKDDYLV
tara:strand:+ start:29524 stop:30051 length:528 start_codon:yes stop_codon:yes gene_type:complete